MVEQVEILLPKYAQGFHLITHIIEKQLPKLPQTGLLNLFLQHTSAGLSLNENADPTVRIDLEAFIQRLIPEGQSYFTHTLEGDDDMPAHIKAALIGAFVSIPITDFRLNLGTWQGIYLCEFRRYGGRRKVIATIIG